MGFDIGCNRKEWCFPGAVPIDLEFDDEYIHIMLIIFLVHHVDGDWVEVLDYWTLHLNMGFDLPHYNQEYWSAVE